MDLLDPFSYLPHEMWEKIFDRVEGPQDWLNLYRTNSSFKQSFEDKRAPFLFPKLLPAVFKYLIEEGEVIFRGALLPLRLVSREVKKVVDQELETFHQHSTCNKYNFNATAAGAGGGGRGRVLQFLDAFSNAHPGNPIIGRSMKLQYSTGQDYDPPPMARNVVEVDVVPRLLANFGRHLTRLVVFDSSTLRYTEADDNMLSRLRGCLRHTPNLEYLEFICDHDEICWTNGIDLEDDDEEEEDDAMRYIGNEPMSMIIPRLKSFRFRWFGGRLYSREPEPTDLQNAMVRLCCNPDTLEEVEIDGVPSELISYPKVTSAEVRLHREQDYFRLAQCSSSWPLSKLTLRPLCVVASKPGICDLFEVAAHFKDTLTSLTIAPSGLITLESAPAGESGGTSTTSFRADLPLLTHLHVFVVPLSFGILGNLSNLQVISVTSPSRYADQAAAEAQLVQLVELEVAGTAAWEMLPNLREINVGWRVRGRENFRKVQMRRDGRSQF